GSPSWDGRRSRGTFDAESSCRTPDATRYRSLAGRRCIPGVGRSRGSGLRQRQPHGMPAIYTTRDFPDAGGLMSYGANTIEASRLGGVYVGRVLKGEKPADLPVQQSVKVELILNLITAKVLGVRFPLTLLGRADEVIE